MRAVVAIDGSYAALHALSAFLELADEFTGKPELHLVAVIDYLDLPAGLDKTPPEAPDLLASEAATALAAAAELVEQRGRRAIAQTLRGHVVDEVLACARQLDADIIVVGTHGRKGVQRAVLGSTCEGLIRRSDIPVLAVRKP